MISRVNKHCTVELQALPPRIGQVRRIVSAQLRYWHLDPLIDLAALGVTELLTNVHQHAEPDKRCTVEIDLMLDRLTVSVRDHDPRLPTLGDVGTDSTHGRGLALVAAVSSSWGVKESHDGGKVVWFTLPVPQTAPAPAPKVARSTEGAVAFDRPALSLATLDEPAFAGGAPVRLRPTALRTHSPARSAVGG
ncbi:ATP-binding protein [Streptomyces sp. NPDC053079]|uniref:ATP-binding protein n=1 Tax=Streptomyces sp. NPDC053079 TaxID=3365697 RepID=UPI0037D8853F